MRFQPLGFVCLALFLALPAHAAPATTRPTVAMYPPPRENGRLFRELFEHPDQWAETRGLIDAIGYADHNLDRHFTDEQLAAWLPMLKQWGIKLELEVGAVKPWGTTGEKVFKIQRTKWDRFQRLGGTIDTIAMDEPLCCTRKQINKSDEYAVEETARFIALVRQHYPNMRIGDIEAYPFIPLADQMKWIEALEAKLKQMNVRGMDFYRLDVNWAEIVVFSRGSWAEVRKLEVFCRQRKIPFSLIYWASDQPGLKRRGLAGDDTWYLSTLRQGNDYAMVEGRPDQYVIESWVDAPPRCVPDSEEWTFTRSVRDFVKRFVRR